HSAIPTLPLPDALPIDIEGGHVPSLYAASLHQGGGHTIQGVFHVTVHQGLTERDVTLEEYLEDFGVTLDVVVERLGQFTGQTQRSEEHKSELQSRENFV